MLSFERAGSYGPVVVFLHWLGGGAQSWEQVSRGLAGRGVQCLALDLPGFGDSANIAGFPKASMVQQVADTVRVLRREPGLSGQPWFLAGHSMGGAVAMLLARRALDGEAGLEDLKGLLLVSPSTPGPEPMTDDRRQQAIQSLGRSTGSDKDDRKQAGKFLDDNTGRVALLPDVRERAIDTMLGMNRTAFRLWMESGSREDIRSPIGQLALPTIVFAGSEDAALGPDAQRNQTLPALPGAELVTLEGAGHLAPLERPGELIELFTTFLTRNGAVLRTAEQTPGPQTAAVMHSDHTSPITLNVMETRLHAAEDWNYQPQVFSAAEFHTLRSLAEAVVPAAGFDLAAAVDRQLHEGNGDGWRFAHLPEDAEAWKQGLRSLDLAAQRSHKVSFLALNGPLQHDLLADAHAGKLGRGVLGVLQISDSYDAYTPDQMKLWFQDVRAEFTRHYIADPRTMDRIGYTGFADDWGFTQIQLGQQERFER